MKDDDVIRKALKERFLENGWHPADAWEEAEAWIQGELLESIRWMEETRCALARHRRRGCPRSSMQA